MKEITEKEALNKAAAYCSSAERCQSEIESKLANWGVDDSLKEIIIDKLRKEKYFNENRYCLSFINDKLRFNKWGKLKIGQALRQKGIASSLIKETLEQTDPTVYNEILVSLINSKRKITKATNKYELNGKLIRFALSRGFELSEIQLCIKKTDNEGMD